MEARVDALRAGVGGERAPAVHPLHLGLHREAQGRAAHHRRLRVNASLTTRWVFDLREDDVYWCTADVGWVTGHSYVVYGPLMNGATTRHLRGRAHAPGAGPLLGDHRALQGHHPLHRAHGHPRLHAAGRGAPAQARPVLAAAAGLAWASPSTPRRGCGTATSIGGGRCPVVDTWWQTETGGIMISPLPGATPTKPGSATLPLPGIHAKMLDRQGNPVPAGQGGLLFVTKPWPSMLRTVWGNPERYVQARTSASCPASTSPATARGTDADGYFWLMGRVDDVVNVAGHRLGTAEVESALVSHPRVAEAAVVGRPDELKGTALVAFVTLKQGSGSRRPSCKKELAAHVAKEIGAIARPDEIRFAEALPKTRSGKIMRRLLRDVAAGKQTTRRHHHARGPQRARGAAPGRGVGP